MKKIFAWLLLPIFLLLNILTLCVWDILLKILYPLNSKLHKFVLDRGIYLLIFHLKILGTKINIKIDQALPKSGPAIIISNHQSIYDIPLLMWYLRQLHPAFVAKKELGKWVPSVSCTLRRNGSALIDRSDRSSSVRAIKALASLVDERNISACIFPEGTRSRDGKLRRFKVAGAASLIEGAPNAVIIPVAIDGTWQLAKYNFLPVPIGSSISLTALAPIERGSHTTAEILAQAEAKIRQQLKQPAQGDQEAV